MTAISLFIKKFDFSFIREKVEIIHLSLDELLDLLNVLFIFSLHKVESVPSLLDAWEICRTRLNTHPFSFLKFYRKYIK